MIVVPSPDYRVQFRSACAGHADRYHFFKGKAVSAGLCAHRYWPLYGKTRYLGKSLEHLYNIIHNPNNPMHIVGYDDEYAQSGMGEMVGDGQMLTVYGDFLQRHQHLIYKKYRQHRH